MRPGLLKPALATAALLAACGADLPSSSHVDKLRVLAVRAEPPEVAPGQETVLTALTAQPLVPAAPPLSRLWLACALLAGPSTPPPFGVSEPVYDPSLPACSEQPAARLCQLGSGATARYVPDAAVAGSSGSAQLLITVVVSDAGTASDCMLDIAQHGGLPTRPDHCVVALKRLTVSEPARTLPLGTPAPPPNRNPGLTSFELRDPQAGAQSLLGDGAEIVAASARKTLAASRADDAAEIKPDGTYEQLSVSWFATAGKLDGGRSTFDPSGCDSQLQCARRQPTPESSTRFSPPSTAELAMSAPAGGKIALWVVVRDDRGGVGWLTGSARAR